MKRSHEIAEVNIKNPMTKVEIIRLRKITKEDMAKENIQTI